MNIKVFSLDFKHDEHLSESHYSRNLAPGVYMLFGQSGYATPATTRFHEAMQVLTDSTVNSAPNFERYNVASTLDRLQSVNLIILLSS